MKVLLTTTACVVLVVSSLAGQHDELPLSWFTFTGFWRMDPAVNERSPDTPFLLEIRISGEELTIARRGFKRRETSRYRMDGSVARTVDNGRPADGSAAVDGRALVIKRRVTLSDGGSADVIETYSVNRKIMTIDRTTTVGKKTTTENESLLKLPDPRRPIHPGPEDLGQ